MNLCAYGLDRRINAVCRTGLLFCLFRPKKRIDVRVERRLYVVTAEHLRDRTDEPPAGTSGCPAPGAVLPSQSPAPSARFERCLGRNPVPGVIANSQCGRSAVRKACPTRCSHLEASHHERRPDRRRNTNHGRRSLHTRRGYQRRCYLLEGDIVYGKHKLHLLRITAYINGHLQREPFPNKLSRLSAAR